LAAGQNREWCTTLASDTSVYIDEATEHSVSYSYCSKYHLKVGKNSNRPLCSVPLVCPVILKNENPVSVDDPALKVESNIPDLNENMCAECQRIFTEAVMEIIADKRCN